MRIIYENDEGGVSVIIPSDKSNVKFLTPTAAPKKGASAKEATIKLKRIEAEKYLTDSLMKEKEKLPLISKPNSDTVIIKEVKIFKWHLWDIAIPITDEIWVRYVAMKDVPEGKPFEIVATSEIPSDRIFRNAWGKNGVKIKIDMPKARLIQMDKIRETRNRELDKSDKQVLKKLGIGEEIFTLETKRQALRDIPQTFDLSGYKTPETLKAAWPDDLPHSKSFD